MARPNWEFIRVDVLLPDHPKLDGLSYAAKWTLIELLCYCGKNTTDGFVRDAAWRRIGPSSARSSLVSSGLCTRVEGGFVMHDYLEYQRSRDEIAAMSQQRRLAGERSGQARSRRKQTVEQTVQQTVEQNANKTRTEAEAEAEAEADLSLAEVSNQSNGSHKLGEDRDSINQMIIIEISQATGRVVTVAWAERIAAHILGGKTPRNPAAYIKQVIRNEPNPRVRFLPVA